MLDCLANTSTGEVFSVIIQEEQAAAFAALENAKTLQIPPDKVLISFLRSRMTQLLDPDNSIDNATAEFATVSETGRELLKKRAQYCVEIVVQILEIGVALGIFSCKNCRETALHIIWSLEGMCKHNTLFPLTQKDVEEHLNLILSLLK